MPTRDHEVLIKLFQNRPSLAPEVLGGAGDVSIPKYTEARMDSGDLTDCQPTEYRADAVITLAADVPVMAIVVEVQLRRDPRKQWSWPVYLATLRARLECPVVLLVLCPDAKTSEWAQGPIAMGHPGWTLRPIAMGPEDYPVITDPAEALRDPELAVLSAIGHSGNHQVLDALNYALTELDQERFGLYTDYVLTALPETAKKYLEELMATGTYEYKSDFARRYVAEGRSDSVLEVLEARSVPVPEDIRERVLACTDVDQLKALLSRAITVGTAAELFDGQ